MNPFNAYKQATVAVAPGRLLVMLYDGLLRFIDQAQISIEARNIQDAHKNLIKCQDIVLELRSTLDKEKAPELCDNLYDLYTYMYTKLIEANRDKKTDALIEIRPLVAELRDAFDAAERQLSSEGRD